MKALVIGCTGQDGSLLASSLLQQNHEVIGISRSSNPNRSIHDAIGISNECEVIAADICDFREMLDLINRHQPNEIYNLAAQSSVSLSFQQPIDTFRSIINGTVNLLEVCRHAGYRGGVYFAGSSEIFGNTVKPANAQSRRQPMSPYAIAKEASFNTVRIYREAYNLHCMTGILFNHESPYRPPTFVTGKIIQEAIRCRSDRNHRFSLGNLQISRDWGWAEEYVEAMQLMIRADHAEDEVICTGRMETLAYVVQRVFESLDLNWHEHVQAREDLFRISEVVQSVGDKYGMKHAHGWSAKIDIDGVVDRLVEYALEHSK